MLLVLYGDMHTPLGINYDVFALFSFTSGFNAVTQHYLQHLSSNYCPESDRYSGGCYRI